MCTDVVLDRRVDVGVRADRSAELAHGDRGTRVRGTREVAIDLEGKQRELLTVGRGLGVHTVGAADNRRVDGLLRATRESIAQRGHFGDDDIHRLA